MRRSSEEFRVLFVSSILLVASLFTTACADSIDGDLKEPSRTTQQPISTSHQFSAAPDNTGPGNWETTDVVFGDEGATYLSGNFWPGYQTGISQLTFGCDSTLENPSRSLTDVFLVKFNENGQCQWQKSWGNDETDIRKSQTEHTANDLELTPTGNIVLVTERLLQPAQPTRWSTSTAGRIRELDSNGNTVWMDQFPHVLRTDVTKNVYKAVDIVDGLMVVAGEFSNDFNFAGAALNSSPQLMVLAWDSLSGGTRTEQWARQFGGTNGSGTVTDVDAHQQSERITVVGNYTDDGSGHTYVDGTSANAATNWSFFLESLDFNGNQTDKFSSPAGTTGPADSETVGHVEFAPDGEVYIGGQFHGQLDPNGNLAPNYKLAPRRDFPLPEASHSSADDDYFIIRYTSADQLGTDDTWLNFSNLNPGNTSGNPNSPKIMKEKIWDMQAFADSIAITGQVVEPPGETGIQRYGFAHIHDFSQPYVTPGPTDPEDYVLDPSAPSGTTEYDIPYENSYGSGLALYGRGVAATTDWLAVAGLNVDTNYSLGGPTLAGGYGFLVSYEY